MQEGSHETHYIPKPKHKRESILSFLHLPKTQITFYFDKLVLLNCSSITFSLLLVCSWGIPLIGGGPTIKFIITCLPYSRPPRHSYQINSFLSKSRSFPVPLAGRPSLALSNMADFVHISMRCPRGDQLLLPPIQDRSHGSFVCGSISGVISDKHPWSSTSFPSSTETDMTTNPVVELPSMFNSISFIGNV